MLQVVMHIIGIHDGILKAQLARKHAQHATAAAQRESEMCSVEPKNNDNSHRASTYLVGSCKLEAASLLVSGNTTHSESTGVNVVVSSGRKLFATLRATVSCHSRQGRYEHADTVVSALLSSKRSGQGTSSCCSCGTEDSGQACGTGTTDAWHHRLLDTVFLEPLKLAQELTLPTSALCI